MYHTRKKFKFIFIPLLLFLLLIGVYKYIIPKQQRPSYPMANAILLQSISMDASDDGWAVGSKSGYIDNVLMHYHKGQWTIISPFVNAGHDVPGYDFAITGISMLSPTDGWAIGNYFHNQTNLPIGVILHYSSGQWTIVESYPNIEFSQIRMPSPQQGWILGTFFPDDTSLIFHYTAAQWKTLPLPNAIANMQLITLSALATGDIEIVNGTSSVFRYDGLRWTDQTPNATNTLLSDQSNAPCSFQDITLVSSDEFWAVGGKALDSSEGCIMHYVSGQWRQEYLATTNTNYHLPVITKVSALSSNNIWAVDQDTFLHYTDGQWSTVTSPAVMPPITQIFLISPDDGWAVGWDGTILHYQQGNWNLDNNVQLDPLAQKAYSNN